MSSSTLHNERRLLLLVSKGDESAYQQLFHTYWDYIYSTALMFTKSPELSEDLSQDIFVRIWIKREQLAEIEQFDNFLFITARNLIFDHLRKKVFSGGYDDYFLEYFKDAALSPDQQLEFKEFENTIREAIDKLPVQQQTAFRLSRFQGLSHEEIARQMGISRQSVKSYIVRSMVSLRKMIKEHPENPMIVLWILFFL
ncbi:MAG TPA: RNA polymerase sigma-70 factor [Puia sp.]|nr:RNA polymerase sigma-70 factor [Puia sp.]